MPRVTSPSRYVHLSLCLNSPISPQPKYHLISNMLLSPDLQQEQEEEADRGDDLAEEGRCAGLLRAGWWLAKRLATAGAAVTAAPLVAPPLFLIYAVGLAFSLPFTILFAGYAATSKVLGYLLSPQKRTQLFLLEGSEGYVLDEMPVREGVAEEAEEMPTTEGEETVVGVGKPPIPVVDIVEEPVGVTEVEVVEAAGEQPVEVPVQMAEAVVHPDVGGPAVEKEVGVVEDAREEPVEIPVQVAVAVAYPVTTLEFEQEGALVGQQPVVTSEYELEVEKPLTPAGLPVDADRVAEEAEAETAAIGVPSEEGLYGLDEISAEIDALRVIVGSTAARLASPIEELKALYLFTGVEPPTSLREDNDLEEIRSRLQFLKSVVGV